MTFGIFIDIGLTNIGYCIGDLTKKNLISYNYFSPNDFLLEYKLKSIYNEFLYLIKKNDIKLICFEKAYFNGKQGYTLGSVMGILLLLVAENNLGLIELSAKTIKKSVTGNGNSNKDQLYKCLLEHFTFNDSTIKLNNHITDSVGVYFTYLKQNNLV